ncbi:Stk1 family PASTA domain-containing Ser/Thr kinase [Paenibacillus sp. D2_2]|uniref:Stk1 family PASTA domain-containing Ser/Thr kinase n=1 Tax=Paenibacillus sp. D2_2 TaxID=3073092 RepID=UPI002815ADCC|nr:Stk1 family PASTA domain-containing Ser/Thr kinase [Paenibacillus sp. D2_2]WMT42560.1 Stk1 family PASTA domain-containing Ser/Thr kinase [Paenibacillus sp. D2_2]
MIGHELGGRYQIIERIGGGGMALVYRAQDILLNRNVAIKVLRQQFVNDEEFIRRFRREAQSAASLSHPNIVSVYDVGQEGDVHYIVMEYIEGRNLNEIIKERAPLQVDEAVRIASQIADALDHAHTNHIIHRDIKPHNILIGRNGWVKVTDFGIARAVSSTTITQTGSVIGSVHYFSPEHAKGVTTGEKSDLYSLGIVLYQMLTGRLPFLGESPISVALKHLQEHFDEPRSVNPMIPQSVENIILKSMRKNPGERYESAKEMLRDLETSLLPERRTENKLTFVEDEDEDSTRVVPAIKPQNRQNSGGSKLSRDDQGSDERQKQKSNKKPTGNKTKLWVGITLIVIVAMLGIAWYVNKLVTVEEVKVPNVLNMSIEQATEELSKVGIVVGNVAQVYKEGVDEGIVYEQSKSEGTAVKEGSSIDLTVSTAKELPQMPMLMGGTYTYEEAVAQLEQLGVSKDRIRKDEENSDKDTGEVIGQTPDANATFNPDTDQIILKVSKGPANIKMPKLEGLTQAAAVKAIEDAGLKLAKDGIKQKSSYDKPSGEVMEQWPYAPGGDVAPGSEVTIFVSSGYPSEAIEYTFEVPVVPSTDGQKSKIHIIYGDARGENQDWGTRTITKPQYISVDLVLAPNKDGYVYVNRDGALTDTYKVSYIDAKQGTVPQPSLPVTNPTPDESNNDPNGNNGDNNSGNNDQNPPDTGMVNKSKITGRLAKADMKGSKHHN